MKQRKGKGEEIDSSASWPEDTKRLDLKTKGLTALPDGVLALPQLAWLGANHNDISSLPADIGRLSSLTNLRMFGNRIESLGGLGDLHQLRSLDLGKNCLSHVDADLSRLTAIRDISLQWNQLVELPDEIGTLSTLRSLSVSINQLSSLPLTLSHLTGLESFDMSHNSFAQVPAVVGTLTNLTSLNLVGNDCSTLCAELASLTKLATLNAQFNQLKTLPNEIGDLPSLRVLQLRKNQIKTLPNAIGQLTTLAELYISDNDLIELPRSIRFLTSLVLLHASDNGFIYLPPELGCLINLRELDLAANQIEVLPKEFGNMSSLRSLFMSDNNIYALPRTIGALSSLTELSLFRNSLQEIPMEVGHLDNLQQLNLASNRLASIPSSLGLLSNLWNLELGHNALESVPDEVFNLPSLVVLNLTANRLTCIPEAVTRLTRLQHLFFSYNPLTDPKLPNGVELMPLRELHLAGCGWTSFPSRVLGIFSLEMLSLSNNAIACIDDDMSPLANSLLKLHMAGNRIEDAAPLAVLTKLTELDLTHNALTCVPDTFMQLVELRDLDVSGNAITRIPDALPSLPNLLQLKLAYNELSSLPKYPANHAVWMSTLGNCASPRKAERMRVEPPTVNIALERRFHKLIRRRKPPKDTSSVYSVSIGWSEMIGKRPGQEDTVSIIRHFAGDPNAYFFAVFDGHGGALSSEFSASYLHGLLEENMLKFGKPETALKETFRSMHMEIERKGMPDGTAALVVYLAGNRVWLANAGDSRAIMCRKGRPFHLSRDHKSDSPDEKRRIKDLKGFITEDRRVNGVLALSRALGDCDQQPHVTWLPDVLEMPINNSIEYIIMACDGLWDVLSNEHVVEAVLDQVDPKKAATKLRDMAYCLGSTDNISVIVVKLDHNS